MEIYLNATGELACSSPNHNSTVADLIDAVIGFCRQHIDCSACHNTCCAGLSVYADNIFLKNLTSTALRTMDERESIDLVLRVLKLDHTMKWTLLKNADSKCTFLSRKGKCLIYEARPLVCRLHTCINCEPSFQEMKNTLYYAYQEALKVEMQDLLPSKAISPSHRRSCANPLLGMTTYDSLIPVVISWSLQMQRN